MSRHSLQQTPISQCLGTLEITIGWDRPLNTYFVSCFNLDVDEEEPARTVLWKGCYPNEIPSADMAILEAAKWALIPEGIKEALLADKEAGR